MSLIRKWLPLLLVLVGVAALVLLVATRPQQPPTEARERVWTVETVAAERQTLSPTLHLYGEIVSPRAALLTSAVTADVIEVPVRDGEQVAAGQRLVQLDEREARLLLQQREAQVASEQRRHANDRQALQRETELLELARRNLERLERLSERQAVSDALLDEAQRSWEQQQLAYEQRRLNIDDHPYRLAQLEAQRDQAALDLERTEVRAPFAGRVASITVAPGDRVRVGERLLELYDTEALEVRLRLPIPQLERVRDGLDANGTLAGEALLDGRSVPLTLYTLAGRSQAGGAVVEALARLDGEAGGLLLGRFVEVRLSLPPQAGVVALPHEAIYGSDRIYLYREGRMRAMTVERVGEHDDGTRTRILVRAPALQAGDAIIVTRLPNAMDGLRVAVAGE